MIEIAIEDLITLALEFKPIVDVMPDKEPPKCKEEKEEELNKKGKKRWKVRPLEKQPSEEEDTWLQVTFSVYQIRIKLQL